MRLHPDAPRRAHRLVGARGDRHRCGGAVAGAVAAVVGRPPSTSASTPRSSPCPGGCGCAKGCRAARRSIVTELWYQVFGRAGARTPREKRQPRTGRSRRTAVTLEGAEADAAIAESRRAHDVATRARRATTLRTGLAGGRRARRGGGRGGLVEDPDETLALLADLAGATDRTPPRPGPPTGGAAVPRPRPSRPVDAARRRPDRRAAVPARRRRPRPRRQPRRDRRSARPVGRPSMPSGCGSGRGSTPGTALCLLVDRSGSMGGKPLATAAIAAAAVAVARPRELQRAGVRQGRRRREEPGRRQVERGRRHRLLSLRGHGTTDLAGALRAAGEQLNREHGGSQDRDPAERLPCDGRWRRAAAPQLLSASW